MLALFVACLCHDIDHRGTTNSFQVSSVGEITGSVLLCAILFKLKVCVFAFCFFVWFVFFSFCLLLSCVRFFNCFQGSTLAALYSSKGSVLEVRAVWLLLLLLLMFLFVCSCFFLPFSPTPTKTSEISRWYNWCNWPQIEYVIACIIGKKNLHIPIK